MDGRIAPVECMYTPGAECIKTLMFLVIYLTGPRDGSVRRHQCPFLWLVVHSPLLLTSPVHELQLRQAEKQCWAC